MRKLRFLAKVLFLASLCLVFSSKAQTVAVYIPFTNFVGTAGNSITRITITPGVPGADNGSAFNIPDPIIFTRANTPGMTNGSVSTNLQVGFSYSIEFGGYSVFRTNVYLPMSLTNLTGPFNLVRYKTPYLNVQFGVAVNWAYQYFNEAETNFLVTLLSPYFISILPASGTNRFSPFSTNVVTSATGANHITVTATTNTVSGIALTITDSPQTNGVVFYDPNTTNITAVTFNGNLNGMATFATTAGAAGSANFSSAVLINNTAATKPILLLDTTGNPTTNGSMTLGDLTNSLTAKGDFTSFTNVVVSTNVDNTRYQAAGSYLSSVPASTTNWVIGATNGMAKGNMFTLNFTNVGFPQGAIIFSTNTSGGISEDINDDNNSPIHWNHHDGRQAEIFCNFSHGPTAKDFEVQITAGSIMLGPGFSGVPGSDWAAYRVVQVGSGRDRRVSMEFNFDHDPLVSPNGNLLSWSYAAMWAVDWYDGSITHGMDSGIRAETRSTTESYLSFYNFGVDATVAGAIVGDIRTKSDNMAKLNWAGGMIITTNESQKGWNFRGKILTGIARQPNSCTNVAFDYMSGENTVEIPLFTYQAFIYSTNENGLSTNFQQQTFILPSAYVDCAVYWPSGWTAHGLTLPTIIPSNTVLTVVLKSSGFGETNKQVMSFSSDPIKGFYLDTNALQYIVAANTTNIIQRGIVDYLVKELKRGAVWTNMNILYTMFGGTNANRINLINTNTFPVVWKSGANQDKFGVSGDGVAGWGDTGFIPRSNTTGPMRTNWASMFFLSGNAAAPNSISSLCGADAANSSLWMQCDSSSSLLATRLNDNGGGSLGIAGLTDFRGVALMTRVDGNEKSFFWNNRIPQLLTNTFSTGTQDGSIGILALNSGGVFQPTTAKCLAFGAGGGMNNSDAYTLVAALNTYAYLMTNSLLSLQPAAITITTNVMAVDSAGRITVSGQVNIPTNTAPVNNLLNAVALNASTTNGNWRASYVANCILNDSAVTGAPFLVFSNFTAGIVITNANTFVLAAGAIVPFSIPDTSPNDVVGFYDKSTGSASVTGITILRTIH